MTTHPRLLATTMLSGLAVLSTPLPVMAEDLIVDDGEPVAITTPGVVYNSVVAGYANSGQSLTVSGSGQVRSSDLVVGYRPEASDNVVTVAGPEARWHIDGDSGSSLVGGGLFLGYDSSGNQLVVRDGGRIDANAVTVAFHETSTGNSVRVAGEGSVLSVADGFLLGQINGGNTLLVENGASLVSGWGSIGYFGGSDNSATITGQGSSWKIGENPLDIQTLLVGGIASSGNSLTISDGGTVEAFENVIAGGTDGADGNTILVSGEGSSLLVHQQLVIGLDGDGNSLVVNNGGQVQSGAGMFIGGTAESEEVSLNNHAEVTGQGSSLKIGGDLAIGHFAPSMPPTITSAEGLPPRTTPWPAGNDLRISDGASVSQTNGNTFIGSSSSAVRAMAAGEASSVNSLIASGAGSSFSTTGRITVGDNGALVAGEGASIQAGSLGLSAGSLLGVYVSDTAASQIKVAGAAALDGALHATIGGALTRNRYTVLDAASTSGDFTGFSYEGLTDFLSVGYELTGTGVDLVFASDVVGVKGLNQNQRNVAGALDRYFNRGGQLSGGFSGLFGLSQQGLTRALSELSGEVGATGGAKAGEQVNTYFLTLLTRGPADRSTRVGTAAAQLGNMTVLPTADAPNGGSGWSMWGAVYGGAANLPGDDAKGSHDTDTNALGVATGWDYAVSDDTTLGLALAGGGTTWDLDSGMGSGDSTFLQLGANARHRMGASYLSVAGVYAWHAMSTERQVDVPAREHLDADFNANSLAGRVEAGHRFGGGGTLGFTPYAALQAQAVYLPEYEEDGSLGGGSFALTYDSNTASAVRGELGLALDASQGPARLTARAAWAHDWNSDGNVDAAFQSLPGASFTVNGAETPQNIALVSLGAEMDIGHNGALTGVFDGEFGEDYQNYSGSLKLGFDW